MLEGGVLLANDSVEVGVKCESHLLILQSTNWMSSLLTDLSLCHKEPAKRKNVGDFFHALSWRVDQAGL